jgi:hypothetical protein
VSSRWWFPFDGMEETSFKRVPEGWVFGAPSPWPFGSRRYYVLNERQKSEAALRLRRMWRFFSVAIFVVVAVVVPVTLPGLYQRPLITLAAEIAVGLAIGLAFNIYLYRTLRPIIAGLEPTTQRITSGEVFDTQAKVFSSRYLMVLGLGSLAMFALSTSRPLLTSDGWDLWSILGALLFGSATIYWLALYVAKRKQVDKDSQTVG